MINNWFHLANSSLAPAFSNSSANCSANWMESAGIPFKDLRTTLDPFAAAAYPVIKKRLFSILPQHPIAEEHPPSKWAKNNLSAWQH